MRQSSRTRIVIAGTGPAGIEAALALRAFAGDAVDVQLLSDRTEFIFTPAATAAPFRRVPRTRRPLRDLARRIGAELVCGTLASVDPDRGWIVTNGGTRIDFDMAIIAVGGRPTRWLEAPGLTFAGLDNVAAVGAELDSIVGWVTASGQHVKLAFVLPPGPSWLVPAYELALMARCYLDEQGAGERAELALVTAEDVPLGLFGANAAETVAAALASARIALHVGSPVQGWADGRLDVTCHAAVDADVVIALPLVEGPCVEGLAQTPDGFIDATPDGRVLDAERVFVAGDAGPYPVKQGGVACQQADRVAAAICADLGLPTPTVPSVPVMRGVLWSGDAEYLLNWDPAGEEAGNPGTVSVGAALWWAPGKVAGRFLTPFLAGLEAQQFDDVPTSDGPN